MNAARFMAGVIDARDEQAADLRICYREADISRRKVGEARRNKASEEELDAALAHHRSILDHKYRLERRNGVEPF